VANHLTDVVDVAIALDTAIQNRLGTALPAIRSAKIWINIDHHPSNPGYGDIVHIDPNAPATGQILFELVKSQKLPVDPAIAENLYVAISTDTGSFQYPNTTARTFEIAAELVRAGVDVGRVSQLTYENYPRRRVELLRDLLGTMKQFAQSLGVRCTFCHVGVDGRPLSTFDFASDAKPNKGIARDMLRLADRLNSQDLPAIGGLIDPHVTCYTCHRGSTKPATMIPPTPAAAPAAPSTPPPAPAKAERG
jgi:hypothetical protein